ncbi:MAG: hypothetical protein QOI16_2868 [Pseudonocardiales bacterium]|nr:hypothetical protein [Pseudonocardiales bacterium]
MAHTTQELVDFGPATATMAQVLAGIDDRHLTGSTPCPAYSVADVVDHVAGLTVAFTAAARKDPVAGHGPSGDGTQLQPGWRERITADLGVLAEAWRDRASHEGFTMAGPIEMPARVAALVALDELVVHAWDLAGPPASPTPQTRPPSLPAPPGSRGSRCPQRSATAARSVPRWPCPSTPRRSTGWSVSRAATRRGRPDPARPPPLNRSRPPVPSRSLVQGVVRATGGGGRARPRPQRPRSPRKRPAQARSVRPGRAAPPSPRTARP